MKGYHYVGLDVHRKVIAYCVKRADGGIVDEGKIRATRASLSAWVKGLPGRCVVGLEATMFTGWVYDFLKPHAAEVKVGHPYMLRAIVAGKKKSDRLDARTLADLLRCDLFPACYMAPEKLRERRRVLRYRNLLVQEATRMKNKTASLLMEVGAEYNKKRLHGRRYFNDLVEGLDAVAPSVQRLLRLSHNTMEVFEKNQQWLLDELEKDPELCERVGRLTSIAGVGPVTVLTWVLEVGDPHRFRSVKQAVSYCRLCSGQHESAGVSKRGPLSKQRNKHLQRVLVEAAKLAPRWNPPIGGRVRPRTGAWLIRTQCLACRSLPSSDWANGSAGMLHGDCFEAGGLSQTQSSAKALPGRTGSAGYRKWMSGRADRRPRKGTRARHCGRFCGFIAFRVARRECVMRT